MQGGVESPSKVTPLIFFLIPSDLILSNAFLPIKSWDKSLQ